MNMGEEYNMLEKQAVVPIVPCVQQSFVVLFRQNLQYAF